MGFGLQSIDFSDISKFWKFDLSLNLFNSAFDTPQLGAAFLRFALWFVRAGSFHFSRLASHYGHTSCLPFCPI